jgi:hypothetical protein
MRIPPVHSNQRTSFDAITAPEIERYRHLAVVRPRNAFPRDWATTQKNLGNALVRLGQRESGTARLDESVAAFRDALQENTRERVPLEWAKTRVRTSAGRRENSI